jgi:hypothetical protein
MAKAIGISVGSVQRIWRAHQLQPHRLRTFKRSRDPSFATKLTDIVGLYIDPPAHAVVLSIDEKSQIQTLDRTQARTADQGGTLPDHDALQAARHHHPVRRPQRARWDGNRPLHAAPPPFRIRFLNAVEREVPAGTGDPHCARQLCHP